MGYIGVYWGNIGVHIEIMEKKVEATAIIGVILGYIGVILGFI